jgi:hypothetical protein
MRKINEGNLYNIEDNITGNPNASSSGLTRWQDEVRRQAIEHLRRQNIPNIEEIIKKTFGTTLD